MSLCNNKSVCSTSYKKILAIGRVVIEAKKLMPQRVVKTVGINKMCSVEIKL